MNVHQYRDFYVRGEVEALARFPDAVEELLDSGWSRDAEAERRAAGFGETYYVFAFGGRESPPLPAANLVLTDGPRGGEGLYVPNVVPAEMGELSPEAYNRIVAEFAEQFGEPAARSLSLETELTGVSRPVESYFSKEAFDRLRRFSALANKSTGSSHPNDRVRWYEFVVAVHRSGRDLDGEVLHTWLVEEGGWTPDRADRLVSEASFGLGLLGAYDGAP